MTVRWCDACGWFHSPERSCAVELVEATDLWNETGQSLQELRRSNGWGGPDWDRADWEQREADLGDAEAERYEAPEGAIT